MLALMLPSPELVNQLVLRCQDRGLILFWLLFEPRAVRITPPLTISEDEIMDGWWWERVPRELGEAYSAVLQAVDEASVLCRKFHLLRREIEKPRRRSPAQYNTKEQLALLAERIERFAVCVDAAEDHLSAAADDFGAAAKNVVVPEPVW